MTGEPPSPAIRLLLLRHGQVPHHRADVAPTDLGMAQSDAAGRWFAEQAIDIAALLSGETRRTIDTANGFAAGARAGGAAVPDPEVSFALRNPDLYLGGHRVNLGEGAAFLAGQVPAMTEADVEASPFFAGFMGAPDRIGYWLEHPNPPGEDAESVGRRIDAFARSLADVPALAGRTVVAITHSPVLRAVRHHHWADYSREPPFLHGYALTLGPEGGLTLDGFATETGDLPPTSRPGAGLITDTTKQEPV
ncbi:MAG: phosphoglycerate mutase family protein [Actinomycetota bacterium]